MFEQGRSKLEPSKMQSDANFFDVSWTRDFSEGIKTDQDEVDSVANFPVPKALKEVQ